MAYLTIDQVKQIVQKAPQGSNPEDIIKTLVQRGHTLEGFGQQSSSKIQKEMQPFNLNKLEEIPEAKPVAPSITDVLKQSGQNIAQEFQKRTERVQEEVSLGKSGQQSPLTSIGAIAAQGALGGLNLLFEPVKTLYNYISPHIPNIVKPPLKTPEEGVQATPKIDENIKNIRNAYTTFKTDNPELAKNFESIVTLGSILGLPKAVSETTKLTEQGIKKGAKGISTDISLAKQRTGAVIGKTKGKILGKTEEQILATPEKDVYKLRPEQRKIWFDNAQAQIREKGRIMEQNIKKDLQEKNRLLDNQTEALNRQIQVASKDEVLRLRPKMIEVMQKQSAQYRKLVEEELAPYAKTEIDADELKQFIVNRYPNNPDLARSMVKNLDVYHISGEPTLFPTISDVYKKTLSLGQEIKGAIRAGTRPFTSAEKLTDDTISALVDYMKTKGVDLSEARKFWAKYAPIRNQFISEAKPFLATETKTKTFAGTLVRVAKGADVNNENFIKELEKLLGGPIGSDVRKSAIKLSAREKDKIAVKLEADMAKMEVQLQKELAQKTFSSQRIAVERQARIRDITRSTLKWAGLIAAGGIVGRAVYKTFP